MQRQIHTHMWAVDFQQKTRKQGKGTLFNQQFWNTWMLSLGHLALFPGFNCGNAYWQQRHGNGILRFSAQSGVQTSAMHLDHRTPSAQLMQVVSARVPLL